MSESQYPMIDRYIKYITTRTTLTNDNIEKAIHMSLKDLMDIEPENPALITAFKETLRVYPESKSLLSHFMAGKYTEKKISEILTIPEKAEPGGPSVPSSKRTTIRDDLNLFDTLYRKRTPNSLNEALELGKNILRAGQLDDQQIQYIEERLNQIEDIIQREDFTNNLPEEVAIIFNKRHTPINSGMWVLARDHVKSARELLLEYVERDPEQYGHLRNWPEASRIIQECEEKIEVMGYKNVAEEKIRNGDWDNARKYYEMYLSVFIEDEAVKRKSEILREITEIMPNVKEIAEGRADPKIFPASKLGNWLRTLVQAAPIMSSSPTYSEVLELFRENIGEIIQEELVQTQTKLDLLLAYTSMIEVKATLDSIKKSLTTIGYFLSNDDPKLSKINERFSNKWRVYDIDYQEALTLKESDSENDLLQAVRKFERVENSFGAKTEITDFKKEITEKLVSKANDDASLLNAVVNFSQTKRWKLYFDRFTKYHNKREQEENAVFQNLKAKLRTGMYLRILFGMFIISGLILLTYMTNEYRLAAIAARTPTPTTTPVIITTTPLPTLTSIPSPTFTPFPTPRPVALVSADRKPYYYYVLEEPNGKQAKAYVTNNQSIKINQCVDVDGQLWVEVLFGQNDNLSGWLEFEKISNISGDYTCEPGGTNN